DWLTYNWQLTSVPVGSLSVIANPFAAITSFVPDLPGAYVAQLIVNDGFIDSDPSQVQIQVITELTAAILAAGDVQVQVTSLSPEVLKNATMQNALLNKLNAVIASIDAGNYADALAKLQDDILPKTDGCANSGAPDNNDWIEDCASQNLVYPFVLNAIARVEALMN
ncbi:MAG TPA: hypothetical protein VN328_01385, partial [Thermodesulfovibrionales bacterium]|nr:hypothetical protein [Thermodesulfovibrionales bacterium]